MRRLLLLLLCVPAIAAAQASFPTKPVKFVVPYPGGGGIDVLARAVAEQLTERWRQPVIVENKPGANTILAAEQVARAAPDGYTLLFTSDATLTINPHLYKKLPYDAIKDFAPVTLLVFLNQMLVVHPSVPAATVKELVTLAREKPGALNYASYGPGSQPHLAMEMLKHEAKVDITHVPYKGVGPAIQATVAGEVQMTIAGAATGRGPVQAGRLKALAIGGTKRLPLLPDVPTFAEAGFPDVDPHAWFGLVAPAGTPPEVIAKIRDDIARILNEPAFREKRVAAAGYELIANTPEEFAAFIRKDSAVNARLVQISGAKAQE